MSYLATFCRGLLLACMPAALALAQTGSVGIGTTAPDASAALDVVSSSRGVLLPRVTSAAALTQPATGLIVYQTGGNTGFYYNAGTPTAPNWQRLAGAGTTSADYIQNQTNAIQTGGFKISGAGTLNGGLTVAGGATVTGTTNINTTTSGGTTNIGTGGTGQVVIGRAGGTVRVGSLTTAGLVTTDASGNLSSTTTSGLDATTASNGLTITNSNVQLGGALTQNTQLTLGGKSLELDVTSPTGQVSQLTSNYTGSGDIGQSFTLPAGVIITQIDVFGAGSGTFKLYSGVPGGEDGVPNGVLLTSQAVTYAPNQARTSVVLTNPVTVSAAGLYSFFPGSGANFALITTDAYSGGNIYSGTTPTYQVDLKFVVYYTYVAAPTPAVYVSGTGTVGFNTSSPTALLDVNGAARLRGLTTAGLVTTDASGNLGSATYASLGTNFIQNGTSQQAGSSFNISGNGIIGGSATVAGSLGLGTSAPVARLQVQPTGDADRGVQVGDNSSAGNLILQPLTGANAGYGFLGFNGYYNAGEQRINTSKNRWRVGTDQRPGSDLFFVDTYDGTTTTPVLAAVTTGNVGIGTATPRQRLEVAGIIYSSAGGIEFPDGTTQATAAVTATGAGFIQNQTTQQASSSFNISGSGTIGGNALVSGRVGIGTTAPNSSLQIAGSVATSIRTLGNGSSMPVTIADTDYTVLMTGNLSLPDASAANKGRLYYVLLSDYNIGGSGYYLLQGNLHFPGNLPFGNSSAVTMGNNATNYKSITVQSDGTQWWVIAGAK